MTKPVRIQLKRTKGFNLQEYSKSINGLECAVVSRPSKWGNPLICRTDQIYIDAKYRRKILDKWVWLGLGNIHTMLDVYKGLFKKSYITDSQDLLFWHQHFISLNLNELKNKNLACWCKISEPCHCDSLFEIINRKK